MTVELDHTLSDAIADAAHPLAGTPDDFGPVLDLVGDAPFVLIGEATHGTHEFHRARAEITRRLIREKGFNAVAVETDWPDAYRVNRYVHGRGEDGDATGALSGFARFPQWMCHNADVLDFVAWLRTHNDDHPDPNRQAGFFGIDLYSLHASMRAVLTSLDAVDADAANHARARYSCFDHFGGDPHRYGYVEDAGLSQNREDGLTRELLDLRASAAERARRDGQEDPDAQFVTEQSARLVGRAEEYYRAMFRGSVESWNRRDTHMAETFEALANYLRRRTGRAKIVAWAHNSHVGDARATELGADGELNFGQLTRHAHPSDTRLIGFSSYAGTVTAASSWDGPAERIPVPPALDGSYEALFHEANPSNFLLDLTRPSTAVAALRQPRLERAIGVIYRAKTERMSHYFHARLPRQFDLVLHYDTTQAVVPLNRTPEWELGELAAPRTCAPTR